MKTKTPDATSWLSPSEVMDALYDVRAAECEALGYALLRQRAKNKPNAAGQLIRSKLAPVRPDASARTTACGVATTARDHRVILAAGAPDAPLTRLLDDYDAAVRPHQRLLAAVLTLRCAFDQPLHDLFDAATAFTAMQIARRRRLSSVIIAHAPGDELSDAAPHVHICLLARRHGPSGWGAVDADLTDTAHQAWCDEWQGFNAAWQNITPNA